MGRSQHPAQVSSSASRCVSAPLLLTALIAAVSAVVAEFLTEAFVGEQLLKRAVARSAVPVIGQLFYREGSRADIAVVHLDQRSLGQAGINWPAPYRYHARVLEAIARSEPHSIVVDFMFDADRQDDSLAALEATLCKLSTQGIKLFLAAPSDTDGYRLRVGLDGLAEANGAPCFQKVSVVRRQDSFDRMAWTYPMQRGAEGDPLPSAALAVYRARKGHDLGGDLRRDLALTWGTLPSARGLNWADDQQGPSRGEARPYCRPWSWTRLLPPVLYFGSDRHFGMSDADSRPVCVFHESVTVSELLMPKEENEHRSMDDLLRGRSVIYGASFNPGDFVVSPVQEEIPGLYLHAMALDNLLTYDVDWKHEAAEHGPNQIEYFVLLFSGYFMVSLVFILSTKLLTTRRGNSRRRQNQSVAKKSNPPRSNRISQHVRAVVSSVWVEGFEVIKKLALFVLLAGIVGFLVAAFAHSFLNLGVLAYMPVIVFCSVGVVSEMTETARKRADSLWRAWKEA